MLGFDKRFFSLSECVYHKKSGTLCLNFSCKDNFTPEIPNLEKAVATQIKNHLGQSIPLDFNYEISTNQAAPRSSDEVISAIESLRAHAEALPAPKKVDKTLHVKNVEYLLGKPINLRPIKIEHLRISPEEQVTAGTIHFLTKREYKREDQTKSYWTLVLNDGDSTLQCVFFPSEKSRPKFEILKNNTSVCVVGVHDRKNDRLNFRITGVSFCEI